MIRWLGLFFFLLALVELFSVPAYRGHIGEEPRESEPDSLVAQPVAGLLHVSLRDGRGAVVTDAIAEAAARTGARFVVAVDPGGTEPVPRLEERGNVDIYVEREVSGSFGHAFVLSGDLPTPLGDEELRRAVAAGGTAEAGPRPFVVAAHPSSPREPWTRLDRYPDGVEVLSSEARWFRWMAEEPSFFFATFLLSVVNESETSRRLTPYRKSDFVAWDTVAESGPPRVALTGFDAHGAWPYGDASLDRWPSWGAAFAAAQSVCLLEEPLAATAVERRRQLYRAFRAGRVALHVPANGPFLGNRWYLECGNRRFVSGERTTPDDHRCVSRVEIPRTLRFPATVRVYKDGELFREEKNVRGRMRTAFDRPGAYRVEVWAEAPSFLRLVDEGPTPYVFYNPIVVR